MKFCSSCKKEKNVEEFYKNKKSKDKLDCWCKGCRQEYNKKYKKENKDAIDEYNKIYHQEHYEEQKEHKKETVNEYRKKNLEKIKEKKKSFYKKHKEKILADCKEYREKEDSKIKRNLHDKERREKDINYRLQKNIRVVMAKALKRTKKISSITENLGCSSEFLKQYLESKFKPGMTWENYGKEWQIDHIIPLTAFDLTNIIHFKAAGNFKNLQPLWKEENLRKFNKFNKEDFEKYLSSFEDTNE